jgi:hypothetical protein
MLEHDIAHVIQAQKDFERKYRPNFRDMGIAARDFDCALGHLLELHRRMALAPFLEAAARELSKQVPIITVRSEP